VSKHILSFKPVNLTLYRWVLLVCLCLLLPSVSTSAPPLEPVTVQLKWQPQFQFAGYYAAQEYGFFHEEGLDVTLVPGEPDIAPLTEVMEGRERITQLKPGS
jgi:ABC-type nitrate/sulfonate/bicarbonate transport system substrate-binding protein